MVGQLSGSSVVSKITAAHSKGEFLTAQGDLTSNALMEYDAKHNTKKKQMAAAKKGHLRPTYRPNARIYTEEGWAIPDATEKKWERKAITLAGLVKEFPWH